MKCVAVASAFLHLSLWQVIAQDVSNSGKLDFDDGQFNIFECFIPCNDGFTGNEVIPGTGCKFYQECWEGVVRSRKECGAPLIYDVKNDYCNYLSETFCATGSELVGCPESYIPTYSSTGSPDDSQNAGVETPTVIQTPNSPPVQQPQPAQQPVQQPQPVQPISEAPTIGSKTQPPTIVGGNAISHVESKRDLIEKYVLISYSTASGLAYPSISYTYDKFMRSLQIMGVDGFGADFKFELWEGNGNKYHYGLVNLAAFLANCMVESIEADTCDELNWQQVAGRHAISNSCGQESRSYQDETCDMNEDIFSCEVVPEMEITAASVSSEERAPPPLQCKPGSGQFHHSGYWDASSGTLVANAPYSNDLGRTDTEGCCFFGRGALLTRGVCNHGKINYYLGKRGADLGRSTLYPTVDFCEYPEETCVSIYSEELRWTTAFFEWAERVQRYHVNGSNGWDYEEKLTEFVDNGMLDDSFINSVSRILSRGCHASGCSDLEVRMIDKRRSNFYLIINDIFDVNTLMDPPDPTRQPTTQRPTQQPMSRPSTTVNIMSPPGSPPSPQIIAMPTTPNPKENPNINPSPTEPLTNFGPSIATSNPTRRPKGGNSKPSPDNELIGLEGNGVNFCRNQKFSLSLILSTAALVLLI
mmetsp:Transcript_21289/g.46201  ORF Transcript_21289/g.46201 Transcript_21289/m.46201 type:complete len:643 (+) Transcript_21289:160-2088(+)|eukprot:CAMPEP_0172312226 /NCGR_PEP_ID=MMETSP1058-20130122/17076_1 /TAXON_ID=83371 /ORGANISM="Detonula confervacea, Strain CCMP 353" /LENGTH=642 /DNA_ID=CAMNT_0013025629 /DNA_START=136 /DNA_END=2064 /DNA_ORIENTATION=+